MKKTIFSIVAVLLPCIMAGCNSGGGGSSSSSQYFKTAYGNGTNGTGFTLVDAGVSLLFQYGGTAHPGSYNISATSDSNGIASPSLPFIPDSWLVTWYPSNNCNNCNATTTSSGFIYQNSATTPYILGCNIIQIQAVFSPTAYDQTYSVSSMQLTSQGGTFDPSNGNPLVYMWDSQGNALGTTTATSVSSDGSSLTFDPSALGTASNLGTAIIGVYNIGSDTSAIPSLAATLSITASSPSSGGGGGGGGSRGGGCTDCANTN